jgi:hypothetical protein
MEFNFTNRTEYLAQVAELKAEYAAWSWEIRNAKRNFKEAQIAFSKIGNLTRDNSKEYWDTYYTMQDARSDRISGRIKAAEMIEARHKAKVEANRQYLTSKA